jgi:hypothetical protein
MTTADSADITIVYSAPGEAVSVQWPAGQFIPYLPDSFRPMTLGELAQQMWRATDYTRRA